MRYVSSGDFVLLFGGVEDGRAVGGSYVVALAVELGGVVDDGEEDLEEFAVGDFGRVVDDLDGFGVAGGFGGDLVVGGGVGRTSGVTGGGCRDALDALEDGLGSPEAAAGEDGGLFAVGGGQGGILLRRGEGAGFGAGAAGESDRNEEGGGDEVVASQGEHEWTPSNIRRDGRDCGVIWAD